LEYNFGTLVNVTPTNVGGDVMVGNVVLVGPKSIDSVVGAFVGFGVGTWVGEFVGSESESIGDGVTGNVGKFVRVGRKEIVGNLVLVGYHVKVGVNVGLLVGSSGVGVNVGNSVGDNVGCIGGGVGNSVGNGVGG